MAINGSDALICEYRNCTAPVIPSPAGRPRKFCKKEHTNAEYKARRADKERAARYARGEKVINTRSVVTDQVRKPPDEFVRQGWAHRVNEGEAGITVAMAAEKFKVDPRTVRRWIAYVAQDETAQQLQAQYNKPPSAQEVLEDFQAFRARYFKVPDHEGHVLNGQSYRTPEFQKNWANAILDAREHGKRLMILSPPRHGKSEMLAHFVIWLICRNRNIRILWIGGNADIAEQSVYQVMDELENNELLISEQCGPGGSFRPRGQSGKSWSAAKFTVEGRTITGLKSPTMVAIGKGGKLLSRDADLIIADDIVDHGSTVQPAMREKDLKWFKTQVTSRKEAHTGVVVIGSRQHFDDIYSSLLENPTYTTIVEQAHDDATCSEDPDAGDAKHQTCTLFPELRPHSWLMDQRADMGAAQYEMVYLNRPRVEGMAVFDEEAVKKARNPRRRIGDIPKQCRLIAGLDPASRGYQAAVLWAFDVQEKKRYLVDLENELGGGLPNVHHIIKKWFEDYGLTHWVVEINAYQEAIVQDEVLKAYCAAHGIKIDPHYTHRSNKSDPSFGVTSLAPKFEEGLVDLPYADQATQGKVNQIVRQWLNFSDAVSDKRKGYKTDLVMAAWFPEAAIRNFSREFSNHMVVDYRATGGEWQSGWQNAPWATRSGW